jgi:hypothetical protein
MRGYKNQEFSLFYLERYVNIMKNLSSAKSQQPGNTEERIPKQVMRLFLERGYHGTEPEFRRIYKKYQKFLSRLILQGKKEKVFKKEIDAGLTALVVMAFHDGILLQWSMNKDEIDGESYVNTFKKIMLQGLMA